MNFRGRNIDLVGRLRLWFSLSLAVMLIGLASLLYFRGLNLGIDFSGGGQLQYRIPVAQRVNAGQDAQLTAGVRQELEKRGIRGPKVQVAGGDTIVVQTRAHGAGELRGHRRIIEETLASTWKLDATRDKAALEPLGSELVGPVIGKELRNNAIKGVIFGVALIALWIYIRYNFAGDGLRYAVAGIVALLHDVIVLIGLFALIGGIDPRVEIDGAFIAALLTVIGYSINDSVVIFDRIRENLRNRRKEPFNTIVNDSLLETMSRSINTGLTVIIMLVVLLMLGGEGTYNFVLAMLVGIVSGLYSSIFNASMVLVAWNNWDQKKALAARAGRGPVRAGARGAVSGINRESRGGLAAASVGTGRATGEISNGAARQTSTVAPVANKRVELGKAPASGEETTTVIRLNADGTQTATEEINSTATARADDTTDEIEIGDGTDSNLPPATFSTSSRIDSPPPRPTKKARARRRY